jgi:glycosyltransferase involved in cell wall biosynthesis
MYHADLLGGGVARLAGVRAVFWAIHNSNLEPDLSKASTILIARLCARLSRSVPQRIVCCAERAARVHQSLGYDAGRFTIIPNGYDVSLFRPLPQVGYQLRESLGLAANRPVIGLVARFDPQKDHANLIAALARVRYAGWEIETVLIGTDMVPENAILTDLINAACLQESVRLLGRRDDIPALMNALDLHVLSSYGEAFPNVLAEAMACGTPCVTTDVGDAALIVGETGWVVPPGDPVALADAIIDALNERQDEMRWTARRNAARTRIHDHFSLDRMVNAYETLWTDTCAIIHQWPANA